MAGAPRPDRLLPPGLPLPRPLPHPLQPFLLPHQLRNPPNPNPSHLPPIPPLLSLRHPLPPRPLVLPLPLPPLRPPARPTWPPVFRARDPRWARTYIRPHGLPDLRHVAARLRRNCRGRDRVRARRVPGARGSVSRRAGACRAWRGAAFVPRRSWRWIGGAGVNENLNEELRLHKGGLHCVGEERSKI